MIAQRAEVAFVVLTAFHRPILAPVHERSGTTAPVRVEADQPAVAGAAPAQANPQFTAPRSAAAADSPRMKPRIRGMVGKVV
jgi:hypothetical protein